MVSKLIHEYITDGLHLISIRKRSKRPISKDWSKKPSATIEELEGKNVGVHLGPSGLVDIDLDCEEAIKLAPLFLASTSSFGRGGRVSHYVYRGETDFFQYVDPIDKEVLLERRAGQGKQTVFPPSIHEEGEKIEWYSQEGYADYPGDADIGLLAVASWKKKHPGLPMPERVRMWEFGRDAADETENVEEDPDIFFEGIDKDLIELIVLHCPDGSRHNYRLACAGAMYRAGVSEGSAAKMLSAAMADKRLGSDRRKAIGDARDVVKDTYHSSRNKTGANTLITEFEAEPIVRRIDVLCTPELKKATWLDTLEEQAIGSDLRVLEDTEILNGLARLILSHDSRLPLVWAKLKDSGYSYLKELREASELRAKEIKKRSAAAIGEGAPIKHRDAKGMHYPGGYSVEGGVLRMGEMNVIHGELILLAKCPSSDGMQIRFAHRSPSSPVWKHSIAPYRSLIDAKGVLCLAEHGVNVSALEASNIVGYVRDFVAANETQLDRPIATRTGWHESGAYVWGREIIDGPDNLRAEYPADSQIAARFVEALREGGDRKTSLKALSVAVTHLPVAALCIAASLSAPWVGMLGRTTIGVHLSGQGGRGKTRTLKLAGSVWGATGAPGGLAANGVVAGPNSTVRGLEIAASVRNDLPFFLSDIRGLPGLTETMHAILNGDARARATQGGGSTLGEPYRCGAVISEGELDVLSLTTRQGFHRRMFEMSPDQNVSLLWKLGEITSENFGWLGPLMIERCKPDKDRIKELEKISERFGPDARGTIATMLHVCEMVAPLLDISARAWQRQMLLAVSEDQTARREVGDTQSARAAEDLHEIVGDLAPQIADSRQATHDGALKPWLGYWESEGVAIVRAGAIRDALVKRGHDAIRDVIASLKLEKLHVRVGGVRQHCYRLDFSE